MKFIDLSGRKFNRLTVIALAPRTSHTSIPWRCRCECGKETVVAGNKLKSGHTKSCGCWNTERSQSAKLHGEARGGISPEYAAYRSMRQRCFNFKCREFPHYGGRGITVCKGWNTVANFISDVGRKPTPKHTIDRIETELHYSCGKCEQCKANGWPANCKWSTRKQQANNRRSNLKFTFLGETLNITQWSKKFGISFKTLHARLMISKWPIQRALTEPIHA